MGLIGDALIVPPIAVEVIRGDRVESVHRAHAALVDIDGQVLAWSGDPQVLVYPRSALKPLFATAMVAAGFSPDSVEKLALAASSHSGEPIHVETVRALLADAGVSEAELANTPGWPYDEKAKEAWIATGAEKTRVHANCSGKHSAMLTTCVLQGWPIEGYLTPGHPLVALLEAGVSELTGAELAAPGVDGCGAPVWQVPLAGLARAFAVLANSEPDTAAGKVGWAMRTAPDFVGGSKRDVTELMRLLPGSVAKDGADGVYAIGLPDGRGLAVKVEDGGTRAMAAALSGALIAAGFDAQTLEPISHWDKVLGGGVDAGQMNPVLPLNFADTV